MESTSRAGAAKGSDCSPPKFDPNRDEAIIDGQRLN
jgi:hypothetical protein